MLSCGDMDSHIASLASHIPVASGDILPFGQDRAARLITASPNEVELEPLEAGADRRIKTTLTRAGLAVLPSSFCRPRPEPPLGWPADGGFIIDHREHRLVSPDGSVE